MKRFIGFVLGLALLTSHAVAGIMPSIELSGTGVVISATKSGQIGSINTVSASVVNAAIGVSVNGGTSGGVAVRQVTDNSVRGFNLQDSGSASRLTIYAASGNAYILGNGTGMTLGLNGMMGVNTFAADPSASLHVVGNGIYTAGLAVNKTSSATTALDVSGTILGSTVSATTGNFGTLASTLVSATSATITAVSATNVTASGTLVAGTVSGKGALGQHCTYTGVSPTTLVSSNGLNCGAITRITSGSYGISFSTAMSDASYTVSFTPGTASPTFATVDNAITPTTAGYIVKTYNLSGTLADVDRLNLMVTK